MSLLHEPSIHFGKVLHHRYVPNNRFSYPVFYLRIPMRSRRLDPHILKNKGIGDNRFSWLSFFDKDHGDDSLHSLEWVEALLKKNNRQDIDGEIWLHTFPRVLGYVFNPVSFWFCHHSSGELRAIVAEVNNTFGERHFYFLDSPNHDVLPWGKELFTKKIFHVSPFFDVVGDYRFRFMRQANEVHHPKCVSRIDYFQDATHTLMTSVSGTEYALNRYSIFRAIASFPFLTFSVVFKIHWQAIKLWLKGAKFYKKPKPPEIQTS